MTRWRPPLAVLVCLSFLLQIGAACRTRRLPCPTASPATTFPEPAAHERVIAIKKKAWENMFGGEEAAKPHIQARLVGWPQRPLADRGVLPQADTEFLWRVARDTWRGLDALSDRDNGLPMDTVRFSKGSVALADSHIGDYASGTDIGLYLIAIVTASDLRFITPPEAADRIRKVLATLGRLETYRGFFFNYYDTTSLERTSNFVSFVDSAWLTAGLMVARTAFPLLDAQCTRLIAQTDFGFLYNHATGQIAHGYYVSPGVRSRYDYGMLYSEARLGSLIAIGKGDVPEDHWFDMVRVFPAACTGQTRVPKAARIKVVRGHEVMAGYYEWEGLRYVPSWGGSMFEALMPTLVLDELQQAPQSLGANDRAHAEVQRRYALETLRYPVWGISSCATPQGDGYHEYGVKVLGTHGYDAGAVTPHASALALSVTPQAAIANLRALAQRYDIYGEYGFYDAVDPQTGTVVYKYLTLDQSMLFIAIGNYLNDHSIQRRFESDPIAQKALPVLRGEDFFD